MEAIRQIVRIPKNHEIRIKVPDDVEENETVEVVLFFNKKSENFDSKIKILKTAMSDDDFLNDLKDIENDFNLVDSGE